MRIIFWGTTSFSTDLLSTLISTNNEVVAVVTQPDRKRGRGSKLIQSPVKQFAIESRIPVLTPTDIKSEPKYIEELIYYKPDIFIVVAFGQILPVDILNIPKLGSWNIHTSLLPKWRGAAPIQRAIFNGDETTGTSLMLMDQGLDTGPIFAEKAIDINILDNLSIITHKLSKLSSDLLTEALITFENVKSNNKSEFINSLELIDQKTINRPVLYAKQITKEEFKINWSLPSIEIHRNIMAFHPNTYTIFESKRIKIINSVPLDNLAKTYLPEACQTIFKKYNDYIASTVGEIITIIPKIGFVVSTGTTPLLVFEAQLEGKKPVTASLLPNQIYLRVGSKFA